MLNAVRGPVQSMLLDPVKKWKHKTIVPLEGGDGSSLGGTPASLYFDDPGTEERLTASIVIDPERPERYSVPMYPGTYDVSFELHDFGAVSNPVSGEYLLMSNALIAAQSAEMAVASALATSFSHSG